MQGSSSAYQAMPPPWAEQVLQRLGVLEAQVRGIIIIYPY
jgi:hypothetical protein